MGGGGDEYQFPHITATLFPRVHIFNDDVTVYSPSRVIFRQSLDRRIFTRHRRGSSLLSRSVVSSDGGMYQCLAVNEDEESQATAQLVLGKIHRVGRVRSFFSSRRNRDSRNPSPTGECAPPPPPGSGGKGTLAGERGVGKVPIPTRGHTLWYSLYIRTLW